MKINIKMFFIISIGTVISGTTIAQSVKSSLSAKILCSEKAGKVTLELIDGSQGAKVELPLDLKISSFKSGKLKGCVAITKKSNPVLRELSPSVFKNVSGSQIVSISLPSNLNGMEFDLSYDWIAIKKMDGKWISGPVISSGGLENSVENQVESVSDSVVGIRQISSSEGEDSLTKLNYVKSGENWQQSK
jgi:hypothetical protein